MNNAVNVFAPAVGCGAPPTVPNATPSQTTDRSRGAKVTYTCTSGYWFDRSASKTTSQITCSNTAQWGDPGACTRRQHMTSDVLFML